MAHQKEQKQGKYNKNIEWRKILKNSLSILLPGIAVALTLLSPTIINTLAENLGFVKTIINDNGETTRAVSPLWTFILVFFFLVFCLLKLLQKRLLDYDDNDQTNRQTKFLNMILELTRNLSSLKARKKVNIISDYRKGQMDKIATYTKPGTILREIINYFKQIIPQILQDGSHKIPKSDFSISIAYLFNPPVSVDECCSEVYKDKWVWIKDRPGASEVTSGVDTNGWQSSMRVAIRNKESFCSDKLKAHEEKNYIRAKSDPGDKLRGSVFCWPIFCNSDDDNNPIFIATLNISTHTKPFARNEKMLEKVKIWLDMIAGNIEDRIKIELLDLYIINEIEK